MEQVATLQIFGSPAHCTGNNCWSGGEEGLLERDKGCLRQILEPGFFLSTPGCGLGALLVGGQQLPCSVVWGGLGAIAWQP